MIFAIIPAAGHSTRMGKPKLALSLAGRSVLERVIDALRAGGCETILVVVGPHVPELVPLAQAASAQTLLLGATTPDMRATVELGLHWLEDRYHPRPDDPWLLVPADHPTLEPNIVECLLCEYRQSHSTIVVPTFQGRRGHPTVSAWKMVPGIHALTPGKGLNSFFREHAEATLEVPVTRDSVLCDMDTPEDFARIWRLIDC
jgi:molybdenum cofactor cytidylyltransferase